MLLACTLAGGHVKEKVNRYFLLMLALNAAGALTEILLPLQVLLPGAVMQNMAMQVLRNAVAASDYVFACGTFITFTAYLHTFLSGSGKVSKKPFIAMACINFMQLPVYSVVGLHYLLSGRSTQTRFLAQAQVQIITAIIMLSVLMIIVTVLRHIRSHRLKTRVWLSLILYVMVPCLALLPEFFFQGIWISWLGSAIAMFLIYITIQLEQGRQMQRQELAMAESRTAIMLSQIGPHFMYNTLTAIAYLCKRDGAAQAAQVVRDFSKYLRGNMRALSHKHPTPFLQELEHTQLYLSIEQMQYEERLQVVYDIQASDFSLPALSLQPLVENAVKHGVSKREQGGTVTISTKEVDGAFTIEVLDDGVGFSPAQPAQDGQLHVGIENVRQRVESICGGSLVIESTPGQGTKAVLCMPKQAPGQVPQA